MDVNGHKSSCEYKNAVEVAKEVSKDGISMGLVLEFLITVPSCRAAEELLKVRRVAAELIKSTEDWPWVRMENLKWQAQKYGVLILNLATLEVSYGEAGDPYEEDSGSYTLMAWTYGSYDAVASP